MMLQLQKQEAQREVLTMAVFEIEREVEAAQELVWQVISDHHAFARAAPKLTAC